MIDLNDLKRIALENAEKRQKQDEEIAEEYLDTESKYLIEDNEGNIINIAKKVKQAFKDGAEFGYNKANEWHYVKDGDLPKDTTSLYLVRVDSWNFGLSHLYKKYGMYIPTVCEWSGEYFKALNDMAYSNARNINNCVAWKEIVLPEEVKEND